MTTSHAAFMLNPEERTDERHDDHDADRDTSHHRPEDRAVDHACALDQTWQIGLEPGPCCILAGDCIQIDRSVDDPVQARDQQGDEGGQCTKQERGRCRLRYYMRKLTDGGCVR